MDASSQQGFFSPTASDFDAISESGSDVDAARPTNIVPELSTPKTTSQVYRVNLGKLNEGSISYKPATGEMEFKGVGGLIVGAATVLALLANNGSSDGEERQRRIRAESRERVAKEQKEEAEMLKQEAEEKAAQVQQEKEEAEELLRLEAELRQLGIEPNRTVTEEEVRNARLAVGYVANKVNIGIVGFQNEGKSTLVNCLRGMRHDVPGSARVGEAEVTLESKPYVDNKHPNFVWHDVPGGGTENTSAWGYYFKQKLFAYDKLILVHTSTLREMDLRVLQVCKHRGQECIVMRSKADIHIRNCKRNNEYETVQEAIDDYVSMVRAETKSKNEQASKARSLCPQYVDYIVSEMGIGQLVGGKPQSEDLCEQVIDEVAFLEKLGLPEK